jgi:hypothetical protein
VKISAFVIIFILYVCVCVCVEIGDSLVGNMQVKNAIECSHLRVIYNHEYYEK